MASPEPLDLHDENNIPLLAKRLFESYNHDALPFVVENNFKVIDFLSELYPSMPPHEREKVRQILTLEILVKFCQLAENFAAFAIAFKKRYLNEMEEITGIYKAIADYDVGQVMDFYKHIKNRDLDYIAWFMGYPPLSLQQATTRQFVEMYCRNVQRDAMEIAELYENLRLLYDSYKHGYRVEFAKIDGIDLFTFFDKSMKPQGVPVHKDELIR